MLVWIVFAAAIFLALLFCHPHFFQDVQYVRTKSKIRRRVLKYKQTNYSILDRFLDRVRAQPHKPFILYKDETFTYKDADDLSNKAARVFLQSGLVKEGDTVALFLGNEPMFLWLGLVKIGCAAAFLNYNIRSKSLLHCFSCSGATALVAAEGQEGRAGMAAVTLHEGQRFDSAGVFNHVENFLLAYARPRFMRIQSSLEVTGTFKHLKVKLVEEGFNPNQITDPLYFLDEKDKNYVPLMLDIFDSVTSGKIKI